MISRIIYTVGGVITTLLGLRFLFRLLGANPANTIVDFIYTWSGILVQPFAGIFGQDATIVQGPSTVTQSVFDWTALIALIVYGLAVALLTRSLHGK